MRIQGSDTMAFSTLKEAGSIGNMACGTPEKAECAPMAATESSDTDTQIMEWVKALIEALKSLVALLMSSSEDASGSTRADSNSVGGAQQSGTDNAPIGSNSGGGKPGSAMSKDEVLANPSSLQQSGTEGIEVTGLNLEKGSDGKLSENSKTEVNKLIGNLTSQLGVEVKANVYDKGDGTLGLQLVSGDEDSVTYIVPDNTIYSAHTHPSGNSQPSEADMNSATAGAEDAVVPADNIVGNETGEYNIYG